MFSKILRPRLLGLLVGAIGMVLATACGAAATPTPEPTRTPTPTPTPTVVPTSTPTPTPIADLAATAEAEETAEAIAAAETDGGFCSAREGGPGGGGCGAGGGQDRLFGAPLRRGDRRARSDVRLGKGSPDTGAFCARPLGLRAWCACRRALGAPPAARPL